MRFKSRPPHDTTLVSTVPVHGTMAGLFLTASCLLSPFIIAHRHCMSDASCADIQLQLCVHALVQESLHDKAGARGATLSKHVFCSLLCRCRCWGTNCGLVLMQYGTRHHCWRVLVCVQDVPVKVISRRHMLAVLQLIPWSRSCMSTA